jgi:hypothetical protein
VQAATPQEIFGVFVMFPGFETLSQELQAGTVEGLTV